MNTSFSTWLLAGALAASLAWNVKSWLQPKVGPAGLSISSTQDSSKNCAPAVDFSRLNLSAEQRHTLETWRENVCEPVCHIDAQAQTTWEELHRALRDPEVSPESLRAMAAEVNQTRSNSLDACVDSILEVRRVLTKEQLGQLMECCGPTCSSP